jgi:hypothetical protein
MLVRLTARKAFFICLILLLQGTSFAAPSRIQPVLGNIDRTSAADEIVTVSFDGNLYSLRQDRTASRGNWP